MIPDRVVKKLHNKDIFITVQRGIVLKIFMKEPEMHWTADEIVKRISYDYPEMGRATVYRTLNLMVDLGILNRILFSDGKIRYEMQSEDGHQHHHMVCMDCGQIYDFKFDCLEALENEAESRGFKVFNHQLNFYGVCKYCRAYEKEVERQENRKEVFDAK